MNMLYIGLVVAILICALQALRASRLLIAALWLAGVSALLSLLIYLLGAPEVAVIELSVGTGLVTVLFVFAISIIGNETATQRPLLPRPLAWGLAIVSVALLGSMALPSLGVALPVEPGSFGEALWERRGLDMLVQIVLIFSGSIGILGLMTEQKSPATLTAGQDEVPQPETEPVAEPSPEKELAL